jgi:hypothetical protein
MHQRGLVPGLGRCALLCRDELHEVTVDGRKVLTAPVAAWLCGVAGRPRRVDFHAQGADRNEVDLDPVEIDLGGRADEVLQNPCRQPRRPGQPRKRPRPPIGGLMMLSYAL